MNIKQTAILVGSILLIGLVIIGSITIDLYASNKELNEQILNDQLNLNKCNALLDISNEEKKQISNTLAKLSDADMYLMVAENSHNSGVWYWEYSSEDPYYVDTDYLQWSIDSHKEANEYYIKSNSIYSSVKNELKTDNILTLLNSDNTLERELSNKIDYTAIAIEYTDNMIERKQKYSLSAEYYNDYELGNRYYNQYLDLCDKGDILFEEYLVSYDKLLEAYDVKSDF